jgi:antitoxin VapB
MTVSTVFTNTRTQAVRLPADSRFPENVKKVEVRVVGKERVISPIGSSWDSFFQATNLGTEDFLNERAPQSQATREPL